MANLPSFFARLFHATQPTRDLDIGQLNGLEPDDEALLWIDLCDPSAQQVDLVWEQCLLPAAARRFLADGSTTPEVGQEDQYLWVRCVVVNGRTHREAMSGTVLTCVAGPNRVLTHRRGEVPFMEELRRLGNAHAAIGGLSAESFVATLLDRQLATYFDAVSDYEDAIERLEVAILGKSAGDSLPELQRLRRWASRMRRMLAPHRNVFGAMSRPDFRPDEGRSADRHFVALDTRFERAMDMVENARELVIGSFELFSNKTALRTNHFMRVLTFVTVITGVLATVVGAMGMNFQAGLFGSGDAGFWSVVAVLVAFAAGALWAGWRRHWF